MIPERRREFNERLFSPDKYARLLETLDRVAGTHIEFRHNETPVFLEEALIDSMAAAGADLLRQSLTTPPPPIPDAYRVPAEASHPLFVQVDFGLVEEGGKIEPRLVEIQGFPSLYAYQPLLAETYRRVYGLDSGLRTLLSGLDLDSYWALLRQAIVADADPTRAILLEVFPEKQKTLGDFLLTERACGIRTVCLTSLEQDGRKLFYRRDGVRTPVDRIYNRVIVDELDRLNIRAPFDWRDELDVEWAGHPNWYFRLSKHTIPFLQHPFVPETLFLHEVRELPDDLDDWVLKPLYSFAGLGVSVGPSREEVDAIRDRDNWILQRRMPWAARLDTPHGPTQIEVRVMYVWFDGGDPLPVNTIIRTGRGKMMGVDYNKGLEWVGASAAFY
jgi:hypothetical protein